MYLKTCDLLCSTLLCEEGIVTIVEPDIEDCLAPKIVRNTGGDDVLVRFVPLPLGQYVPKLYVMAPFESSNLIIILRCQCDVFNWTPNTGIAGAGFWGSVSLLTGHVITPRLHYSAVSWFSIFSRPLRVTSLMPETLQTSLWVLGEELSWDAL